MEAEKAGLMAFKVEMMCRIVRSGGVARYEI